MWHTFIVALIISGLALVYWRLTLIIIGAFMIAMLVTGISVVTDAMSGHGQSVIDIIDNPHAGDPAEPPAPSPGSEPPTQPPAQQDPAQPLPPR